MKINFKFILLAHSVLYTLWEIPGMFIERISAKITACVSKKYRCDYNWDNTLLINFYLVTISKAGSICNSALCKKKSLDVESHNHLNKPTKNILKPKKKYSK